jgi:hypothetical protein
MKRNFQKLINNLEAEELREELTELYDRFELVRKYYSVELSGDTSKTVAKYKAQLKKLFLPARGRGKRARSLSAKVLKEFANISVFPEDLIELYFYRTDMMMEHIRVQRVDNDGYHASLVSSFKESCQRANKALLGERFKETALELTERYKDQRRFRDTSYQMQELYNTEFNT